MSSSDVFFLSSYLTVSLCDQIRAAEPCNSVSTGLQCEMDPVSQTQARDLLSSLGLAVVGWYHSHPSFQPNPSVRDINTQDQFQVRGVSRCELDHRSDQKLLLLGLNLYKSQQLNTKKDFSLY